MNNKKLSQEEIESRLEGVPETTLEGRVPVSEGVVDGGIDNPTLEDLKKLPPLKRVELSDSLHSLSNDFVFFNHTALFSKGGLDFDPLKEYQIWADNQDLVSYVIFNRSIFRRLFPRITLFRRIS